MNMTRRHFLRLGGAALVALSCPRSGAAQTVRIPILVYHDFAAPANAVETVEPARFAAQMEWLYGQGFRAVSLAELRKLDFRNPGRTVLLTVDDGHVSFMEYAFPLLREYGFPATVNIVGRYVGGYADENHPRLSWDELRRLSASGLVDVGCHTFDLHDGLRYASRTDALAALNKGLERDLSLFQEACARELGKRSEILAWPYGFYDRESMTIAVRAGFKYLLNSEGRPLLRREDLDDIPRVAVSNGTDWEGFRNLFGGGL